MSPGFFGSSQDLRRIQGFWKRFLRRLHWVSENTTFSSKRFALGFWKYRVFLAAQCVGFCKILRCPSKANCVGFLKITRFTWSELRWVSHNKAFYLKRIALGFGKQDVFLKQKCVGFLLTTCIKAFQKASNLGRFWDEPKKPGLIWGVSETDPAPGAQKPNVPIFLWIFFVFFHVFSCYFKFCFVLSTVSRKRWISCAKEGEKNWFDIFFLFFLKLGLWLLKTMQII